MLAAIVFEQAAPAELIRLRLCRDIYHCTPSALRQERPTDVLETLRTLSAETKAQSIKQKTG